MVDSYPGTVYYQQSISPPVADGMDARREKPRKMQRAADVPVNCLAMLSSSDDMMKAFRFDNGREKIQVGCSEAEAQDASR